MTNNPTNISPRALNFTSFFHRLVQVQKIYPRGKCTILNLLLPFQLLGAVSAGCCYFIDRHLAVPRFVSNEDESRNLIFKHK